MSVAAKNDSFGAGKLLLVVKHYHDTTLDLGQR
jgi:hypothetical protein